MITSVFAAPIVNVKPVITLPTKIIYIGGGVGGVIAMPFFYENYGYNVGLSGIKTPADIEEYLGLFDKFLKEGEIKNYQYLFAVTADKYQEKSGEYLKTNGFRAVKTFKSSHNTAGETLTLWTKTQNDYLKEFDLNGKPLVIAGLNCSISTNRAANYRCIITAKTEEDTDETLKGLKEIGYLRIKNTPIYFRVDKQYVVEIEEK